MANFDYPYNSSSNLDAGENKSAESQQGFSPKLQLTFITILVVVSLIFAAGNWLNSLKVNFAIKGNINEGIGSANFSATNSDVGKALTFQNQDTDMDGLSDYDEINIYKTSPYLPDSDSDGYLDGEEVKNGENPNCPVGQTCGLAFPAESATSPEELSDLSVEEIRQILLKQGVIKEEDLSKIDDQTLRNLYLETLNETEAKAGGLSELKPEQNLELITPEQLRAILLEQPEVKSEDINSLTDEELMAIWAEILKLEGTSTKSTNP
jgi:hypothetical protein